MKKTILIMLALLLAVGGMARKPRKKRPIMKKAKSSRKAGTLVRCPW